jgi:hypothetical protein
MSFETKNSGVRAELANGMVRDSETDKTDYTLAFDGPLFERWVALLGRGAVKYQPRNWCRALGETDVAKREITKDRFKRSAIRHMMQWLRGDRDEDHAAAVIFNMNGFEAMLETDPKVAVVSAPSVASATAHLTLGMEVRVIGTDDASDHPVGSCRRITHIDNGTVHPYRVSFRNADPVGQHFHSWYSADQLEVIS